MKTIIFMVIVMVFGIGGFLLSRMVVDDLIERVENKTNQECSVKYDKLQTQYDTLRETYKETLRVCNVGRDLKG